jgi:hypothetical protein
MTKFQHFCLFALYFLTFLILPIIVIDTILWSISYVIDADKVFSIYSYYNSPYTYVGLLVLSIFAIHGSKSYKTFNHSTNYHKKYDNLLVNHSESNISLNDKIVSLNSDILKLTRKNDKLNEVEKENIVLLQQNSDLNIVIETLKDKESIADAIVRLEDKYGAQYHRIDEEVNNKEKVIADLYVKLGTVKGLSFALASQYPDNCTAVELKNIAEKF